MAKSIKNKTIDTTLENGGNYLERCIIWQDISSEERDSIRRNDIEDTIINGDTFHVMDQLNSREEEGFVDLLVADPPYNLNKDFNGRTFRSMTDAEYESYTRRWIEASRHLLKKTGSVYVCCDWQSSIVIGKVLGEYFKVRNRITWQREKGRGAKTNWKNSMEDIWFATVSDDYTFNVDSVKVRRRVVAPYRDKGKPKDWMETEEGNFRNTHPSNFWDDITVPFWSMAENTAHPTQKPEKLIAKLILASSNPGDFIFDPFMGAGTTAVVAKKLKRKYSGVEIDKRYCIWAQQRLEMAEKDCRIQGFEDGVFWERNTERTGKKQVKKEAKKEPAKKATTTV